MTWPVAAKADRRFRFHEGLWPTPYRASLTELSCYEEGTRMIPRIALGLARGGDT